jgi:hypothetical protein
MYQYAPCRLQKWATFPKFPNNLLLLFLRPLPVQLLRTVEVPGLYMELAATDFLTKSDPHTKNLFLAIL